MYLGKLYNGYHIPRPALDLEGNCARNSIASQSPRGLGVPKKVTAKHSDIFQRYRVAPRLSSFVNDKILWLKRAPHYRCNRVM